MNQPQAMIPLTPHGMQGVGPIWYAHDVVMCHRKILAIAPTFEITSLHGEPLVYCQEKLFRIKDDIRIYSDPSKHTELLRVGQRNIVDWAGVFDVTDPASGQRIGVLRRKGWRSLARDEWHIHDGNDQPIGKIVETGSALWRRVLKFLPYSFSFHLGSQVVGTFEQSFTWVGYKATMDIRGWRTAAYDRRLAFAGALLLMAVEAKEDQSR